MTGKPLLRWVLRITVVLAVLACLALTVGWSYEKVAEARDARRYPPPGVMVDVGRYRLHLFCEGSGGPTVIIQVGSGEPALLFRPVQDKIAEMTRVCAYDPAGIGWSDSYPKAAQTFQERASQLGTLLKNGNVQGPYVLVPHSYGGLVVRLFARDHPSDVSGAVLVDTAEEGTVFGTGWFSLFAATVRDRRREEWLARFGVRRYEMSKRRGLFGLRPDLFGNVRGELVSFMVRPEYLHTTTDEGLSYFAVPDEMRVPGGFGKLGDVPLIVIRHQKPFPDAVVPSWMTPQQFEQGWIDGQQRLTTLSSDSELIVATKSGHMIFNDQPELMVSAVERVITAAREHVPLKTLN
jgi:pimeloyl-ACP methyl ester carboxylesterase